MHRLSLSRRRLLSLGALLSLSTACTKKLGHQPASVPAETKTAPPKIPYGSRPHGFAPGVIFPSSSEAERDRAVFEFYRRWQEKYIKPGCNPGELVVETKNKPSQLTVSEAHGYGMIILAYMAGADPNAKTQFDSFVRYHRAHPSGITKGLMSWNQNTACIDVGGKNAAIDGDLDIAYALLLADKQWGGGDIDYREVAQWVIGAISKSGIDQEGRYPLLGDWVNPQWSLRHYNGTRVSDFMGSHFRAFQTVSSEPVWNGILENTYWIAETVQLKHAAETGLLPDFAEGMESGDPKPARMGYLEGPRDGSYAYNACRIPLRMATDYMLSGDERPRRIALRINDIAKRASGGDPKNLRGGYHLDGREMVDYETMAFTGPFAVGAMLDTENQAWLDALWQHSIEREMENYYEDTLRMLSLIVLSGNWWGPEQV
jgi:endo-1,4-beta-D-glucanase Y